MDCVLRMRIKERRQDFLGPKEDVDNSPRDGWDWKRDEFSSDIARCADEVHTDFLALTEFEVLKLEGVREEPEGKTETTTDLSIQRLEKKSLPKV